MAHSFSVLVTRPTHRYAGEEMAFNVRDEPALDEVPMLDFLSPLSLFFWLLSEQCCLQP